MEIIEAKAGEGRTSVEIHAFLTGEKGICAFLTGGVIHNGGTVVASPRLKSNAKNEEDRTADIWISAVPCHKDTEAGLPVAKYLAVTINQAVSLTCGIHVDHASKEEIQEICENCMEAARKLAEIILKK